jgi:predicted peptidase
MRNLESLESRIHLSGGAATGLSRSSAFLASARPAVAMPLLAAAPSFTRAAGPAVTIAPAIDLSQSYAGVASDGTTSLPYRFFSPQGLAAGQKVPLILYLHGLGDSGTDNVAQTSFIEQLRGNTTSGQYAAYLLAPQVPVGVLWAIDQKNPTAVESLVVTLIKSLLPYHKDIDPKRIYITGVSSGSQGAWDLMQRFPKFFAAGVPISAGINPNVAPRLKGIPIWAFHGAADESVYVESTRVMIRAMIAAGESPWYTEIPGGGHAIFDQVYSMPALYAWWFAKHLAKVSK